jgi:hypothetical protein
MQYNAERLIVNNQRLNELYKNRQLLLVLSKFGGLRK